MSVEVEAKLDAKVAEEFLKKLESRSKDIGGSQKRLLDFLTIRAGRDVNDHFEKEEGSDGPWTPWSDIYEDHLAKIGRGGNQILQFSGKLKGGFLPASNQPRGAFKWINKQKTTSGFPYAYAHDTGGPRLPRRDFMWLSNEAIEDISEICLNFVLQEKE